MKKIAVCMLLIILLAGCDNIEAEPVAQDVQIEYSTFNLVIDSKTKIVYIDNKVQSDSGITYHIYTPYYSKNGNLCKHVDGKIKEVTPNDE
jgi:uncharacterized protein YcfL